MHGAPVLETRDLTKRYGGIVANGDINFAVREGEIRGVIGPNGAGKSTFFKMLTGEVPPSAGQIFFQATRSPAATSPTSASSASPRATRSTSCSRS